MSNKKFHYVYRITHIFKNLHYYGVRSSNRLPSDDLGHYYFSSSTDRSFINDQKLSPYNYKYKIIKVFNKRKDATELEIKLHRKFNVGVNESFYNKVMQTSTGFCTTGLKFSEERIQKMRESSTGKPMSDEAKLKISKFNRGRKHKPSTISKLIKIKQNMSEETKLKISIAKTGVPRSTETIEKMRKANLGKKLSEETKKKLKERSAVKNKPPWELPVVNDKCKAIWFDADLLYTLWYDTKWGAARLSKAVGHIQMRSHKTMIHKFKCGWVPMKDSRWVEFKETYILK